ncbi:PREDICTED: pollen-specific leucine-rich repeat extensin-like protein 1 [Chinchilla lanigera]|uniref:pollen-specific leucine-rich repeat extensin-like protein 1 n=1 Tax=Chinchilla lanigera TaxID=34839 RepID=UPI00038EBF09|nr:PREDICTED: pollen-specific leucine-rich repeat extensin-like protein 1 [Chinchilla lanigera]
MAASTMSVCSSACTEPWQVDDCPESCCEPPCCQPSCCQPSCCTSAPCLSLICTPCCQSGCTSSCTPTCCQQSSCQPACCSSSCQPSCCVPACCTPACSTPDCSNPQPSTPVPADNPPCAQLLQPRPPNTQRPRHLHARLPQAQLPHTWLLQHPLPKTRLQHTLLHTRLPPRPPPLQTRLQTPRLRPSRLLLHPPRPPQPLPPTQLQIPTRPPHLPPPAQIQPHGAPEGLQHNPRNPHPPRAQNTQDHTPQHTPQPGTDLQEQRPGPGRHRLTTRATGRHGHLTPGPPLKTALNLPTSPPHSSNKPPATQVSSPQINKHTRSRHTPPPTRQGQSEQLRTNRTRHKAHPRTSRSQRPQTKDHAQHTAPDSKGPQHTKHLARAQTPQLTTGHPPTPTGENRPPDNVALHGKAQQSSRKKKAQQDQQHPQTKLPMNIPRDPQSTQKPPQSHQCPPQAPPATAQAPNTKKQPKKHGHLSNEKVGTEKTRAR